jgi:ribosomal protein S27E
MEEEMIISKDMEVTCPCGNVIKITDYFSKTVVCPLCGRVGDISWKWKVKE